MPYSYWDPESYRKAYSFAATAQTGQTVPGRDISYPMHLSLAARHP